MAEFETLSDLEEEIKRLEVDGEVDGDCEEGIESAPDTVVKSVEPEPTKVLAGARFDDSAELSVETAVRMVYCGVCTLPCEYWYGRITLNVPEVLNSPC